MVDERWATVEERDMYQVSTEGRIRNQKTGRERKTQVNPRDGYVTVRLSKDGVMKTYGVHRLVAKAFIPCDDHDLEVNHKDGVKTNNRVDNLEWATRSENMKHAYNNGLNRWVGYNERPVRIVETGEVYRNEHECARAIGGDQPNINACLAGRRRSHHGFHYEYADEME